MYVCMYGMDVMYVMDVMHVIHGMVRYGMVCMVWYGMVWYGMVWYGMVWYGMVWYGMVWYGMVWYVWYGMYAMVWYGMYVCICMKFVVRLLKLTHHCSLLFPLLQLGWHPKQACPACPLQHLQSLRLFFVARLLKDAGTNTDLQMHSLGATSNTFSAGRSHSKVAYPFGHPLKATSSRRKSLSKVAYLLWAGQLTRANFGSGREN